MLPQAPERVVGLRDYLRIVRRRKFAVLLAVAVVVAAAVVSSLLQTPVYAATAEVLRQTTSTQSIFDNNSGPYVDPQRALQTEIRVLESQPVRDAVKAKLGFDARVSARPVAQTDVIAVRAEDGDAKRAATIANAYAAAYIEHRRNQAVDSVLAQATEVGKKISDLKKQVETATGPLRDTLVQQQALFQNRLDQLQVDASLQTGGAQLVNEAEVNAAPVRPRPVRNAAIAIVVGLFFGTGVVFFLEYLDDSIKTKDDLDRAVPSLSTLAMIPAAGSWRKDDPTVISIKDPSSPGAEAYRTLRTSIQFLGVDRPLRSLHFTSANAQEGKTTTIANLGVALARAGTRVVIVCSDLRRPRIHDFFGLRNDVGFTSVLLGEISLAQALQRVPGVERLYLLASGPLPPNPSELLQSRRAAEVFDHLKAEGNFLLVDSPPILPVTDGLVLAKRVDGTVMVCAAGRTGRKEFARTVEMLQQVDAPVIGAVLNGITAESGYGYGYEYRSYRTAERRAPNGAVASNGSADGSVAGNGAAQARRRARARKPKR